MITVASPANRLLIQFTMSTTRSTTIAVSPDEKNRLDEIAEDVFGEAESIPYGATISLLIGEFNEE